MNDQTLAEIVNNNIFEYDMESLRGRYAELSENELNAAIALMMLAHSEPTQLQTTPDNNNEQQKKQKLQQLKTLDNSHKIKRYPILRKIGQRRATICYERMPPTISKQRTANKRSTLNGIQFDSHESIAPVNPSPSTQKLLSTCRNILTEFMRNNIH